MHKRIGILGGLSPESTVEYYQYITRRYLELYGDHHYPEILIFSVRFQPYIDWPKHDQWAEIAAGLGAAAQQLERGGADFIVLATNTMHIVIDQLQTYVNIPFLSILDVVGDAITARGLETVALLGTRFTMEKPLYPQALEKRGVRVIVPTADERTTIHQVIYDELIQGEIRAESKARYLEILHRLAGEGAQGAILGCTEIPLLIQPDDTPLPLFDTTRLHAEAALQYAIS